MVWRQQIIAAAKVNRATWLSSVFSKLTSIFRYLFSHQWVRSPTLDDQGSFHQGPIQALPVPGNALHLILLGQSCPPQGQKEAGPVPLLKVLSDTSQDFMCGILGHNLGSTHRRIQYLFTDKL